MELRSDPWQVAHTSSRRVAPRTSPGDDAGIPLPQHPARVKVTLADGTVAWLADQPEAPIGYPQRWLLVDDGAGVWPWPRALERAARQPWRRQYSAAEPVNPGPPRCSAPISGNRPGRASACGIPDADRVAWVSFGLAGPLFGFNDDRDPVLLPPIVGAG